MKDAGVVKGYPDLLEIVRLVSSGMRDRQIVARQETEVQTIEE